MVIAHQYTMEDLPGKMIIFFQNFIHVLLALPGQWPGLVGVSVGSCFPNKVYRNHTVHEDEKATFSSLRINKRQFT